MMDKLKKQKHDDEDASGEDYDQELLQSIEKLQEVQDELERVNEEASDKVLEVEQKYNEIRRPVYKKRNEVIGTIPDFWLTAFLSHPVLANTLTGRDQEVFKYLSELVVEDFKDIKSGYSISFVFKKNPYFDEEKLMKTFKFSEEGTLTVSGQGPKWKEGMDVTNGVDEGEGKKRGHQEESFFQWFENDEGDMEGPDDIAEVIKDDLWPNPLKYFNNEAEEGDDEDGEEDEGEDDDADEEEGDEDEDDGEGK